MTKNTPKIGFFGWILEKEKRKRKESLLICRFFGFKPCTIVTLMILLKPHVCEKSGSTNQIAGFLNFNISKSIGGMKLIFSMQVHT